MTMNSTITLDESQPLSAFRALLDYLDDQDVVEGYDIDLTAPGSLDSIRSAVASVVWPDMSGISYDEGASPADVREAMAAASTYVPHTPQPRPLNTPWHRPCRTCGATPGSSCRTASGKLYPTYTHKGR